MCTPLEEANLHAAFGEIMRRKHLKPEEVEQRKAKMHIFSTGMFQCPCGHRWQSRFSWVTFNLKEMKIFKRWKMLCRECNAACFPHFELPQLQEMYEKAVAIYMTPKSDEAVDIGYAARKKFDKPHLPYLCEKCGWGQTWCWRRYSRYL